MIRFSTGALVLAVPIALIAANAPAPQGTAAAEKAPAQTSTLKSHMDDHFAHVRQIQEAVIRGDLDAAKVPARWLADHQEAAGLPASAAPQITEMKAAANSVAQASDVRTAAQAAASLVASCGDCHAALKVSGITPSAAVVTPTGPGTQAHMAQHQHAVNMMYQALVAPSDSQWKKGAEALKTAPLGAQQLPEAKDATAAEARIHQLAGAAARARDRSAKVAAYGEVIASCASCHGLHGRVWGPGAPKAE